MRYNVNLCVAYHNTFHAHMTAFRLQPFGDATDPWPAAAWSQPFPITEAIISTVVCTKTYIDLDIF